jgi:hypothetical protein
MRGLWKDLAQAVAALAGAADELAALDEPLSDLPELALPVDADPDDPEDSDDDPPAELPASALVLAGVADLALSRLSVR